MSPPAGYSTEWSAPPTPPAGLAALGEPLAAPDTVGFVHVARGDDPARRYLTRAAEPQQAAAIVCLPTDAGDLEAIYCVSTADRDAAAADFLTDSADPSAAEADHAIERSVATRDPQTPPGSHAVSVLADRRGTAAGSGTLRVPSQLPHDAAVRLQDAGYKLASTTAVADARASKTDAERDCLRAVQRGAAHGMAHASDILAESTTDDGIVRVDGDPLSAQQLERETAATLAGVGITPETVRVRAGDTAPTDPLPADEGIIIHLVPRGPHGYHGHLTRTVVVDSDGGWDRRAFIAANAAQTAARRHCEVGGNVGTVAAEATAELTAYGFSPRANPDDADDTATDDADDTATDDAGGWATVHGVGLTAHEAPSPADDGMLQAGSVLAVETGVVDPDQGRIRLGSLVEVTADGGERLVDAPVSLTP
ncbi:M24 family metallopeptidase [Halonotius roseus]|uniref:M24 family metallopeptidase n=1 Tax=Halonotius roseus TaxID=2511997 RepID=A0A544QS62_9EURY|nr:M24 family metallopeptidase [Halonotius roseus]TQQ82291.1 M24 family metallopeptidase [Halonotius roseus]